MSVTIGFPKSVEILNNPPTKVTETEAWLAIPAVYSVPFNYTSPPQTLSNYGKDVWIRLLPSDVSKINIGNGLATIVFKPESRIRPVTNADNTEFVPVSIQGYTTIIPSNGVSSYELVTPEAFIYSINIMEAKPEELTNIPVPVTPETPSTPETPQVITPVSPVVPVSPTTAAALAPALAPSSGFVIPLLGRVGQTNVSSIQLLKQAQKELVQAPRNIADIIQGQLGAPIQNKNPGWRIFW